MNRFFLLLALSLPLAAQVTKITQNPGDPFSIPAFGGAPGIVVNPDGSISVSVGGVNWAVATKPTFAVGGTTTCDFSKSNLCEIDFGAGNTTLAFTNAHGSGPYGINSCQDAVGGRSYTAFTNIVGMSQPGTPAGTTICTQQFFTYDGSTNLNAASPATCPNCPPGLSLVEGGGIGGATGVDQLYGKTATHWLMGNFNNAGELFMLGAPTLGNANQVLTSNGAGTAPTFQTLTTTPNFPVTVSGAVTSGGIPYFNSTTQESSSALLAANGIVTGGGAGAAPQTTSNFTFSGTAFGLPSGTKINPSADSTTALQITKADGTTRIIDVDTTNARVGINKTPGAFDLDVNGAANFGGAVTVSSAAYILLGSGGAGSVGIGYNGPGDFSFTSNGVIDWGDGGSLGAINTKISRPSSGVISFDTTAVGNSAASLQFGKATKYNTVNTVGWGVPAIYGTGRATAQTAAAASVATYTVGAADGSFIVSANVLVTASATHSFTVTVTYTDEGNTSRTLTLNFSQITGTLLTAITNVQGVGAYEGVPLHIRCKSGTAITIQSAAGGTYTSVTYNIEGYITQIG